MSVSPVDILNYSEGIMASGDCENTFRTVIGRAYYAAFHHASAFHESLHSKGVTPLQKTGIHSKLIHELSHPTETDRATCTKSKQIAYMLDTMKLARVEADYHTNKTATADQATAQITLAKRLLAL